MGYDDIAIAGVAGVWTGRKDVNCAAGIGTLWPPVPGPNPALRIVFVSSILKVKRSHLRVAMRDRLEDAG